MTRRAHHTIDYDPRLDRKLPKPLACGPFVAVVAAVLAIALIVFGAIGASQQQPPTPTLPMDLNAALSSETTIAPPTDAPASSTPTATASASPTITASPDAWSSTGTALALSTSSPTPDYCYWLTPSPTPSATIVFAADAPGATALAAWIATHPPQTPTAAPARELCLDVPTWTPTAQVTFVPIRRASATNAPLGTPPITLPVISPPATWTLQPSPVVIYRDRDVVREVVVTSPPVYVTVPPIEIERIIERIVEVPVEIPVTVEFPVTVEIPIPVYITVVATPTHTPTMESTP